ncbi:phage tail tube protein [Curtobacterium oceanosedimentum]|uniref:phage tail tube protein n=1 Tax=Curtobacterium oceanosedimentum TaxID=465820 RepID=UPI003394F966
MTTQLDAYVGLGKETTYGTAVTPTSFLTFTEETLDLTLAVTDAQGMRPGRRTTLNTQRVVTKRSVGGDLTVEATPSELGAVFAAFLGGAVHTLLPGGTATYQHLFTPSADYLPSFTVQKGIPTLGGGPQVPLTFVGMQASQLELDCKNAAIPTAKMTWVGKDLLTSVAAATPVYPAVNEEFSFVGGSITVGGTVTAPTATTTATGGTPVGTVTDVTLKLDNALDDGGFTLGGGGTRQRPAAALLAKLTGTITAEFSDQVFWQHYTNQDRIGVVLDFKGSNTSDGIARELQLYIPVIVLEGEAPKIKAGSIVTQSINFTILQDLVDGLSPLYVVLRNTVATY